MTFLKSKLVILAILVAFIALGIGCGGAANNQQGASFTLLGFFSAAPDSAADCTENPAGEIGQSIPLSTSDETEAAESGIFTFAGLQNNLTGQFVRAYEADLSYFIAGAEIQPPSTTFPLPVFLNPAVGDTTTTTTDTGDTSGGGSSLPPSFGGSGCSRGFGEFAIVPADVRQWINLNRDLLPEAPFTMIVTVSALGVTSAGDIIRTNENFYTVNFLTDVAIPPTDNSGSEESAE